MGNISGNDLVGAIVGHSAIPVQLKDEHEVVTQWAVDMNNAILDGGLVKAYTSLPKHSVLLNYGDIADRLTLRGLFHIPDVVENPFSNKIPWGAVGWSKITGAYSSEFLAYSAIQDETVVGAMRGSGSKFAILLKHEEFEVPGNGVTYEREGPILIIPGLNPTDTNIISNWNLSHTKNYEITSRLFGETKRLVR